MQLHIADADDDSQMPAVAIRLAVTMTLRDLYRQVRAAHWDTCDMQSPCRAQPFCLDLFSHLRISRKRPGPVGGCFVFDSQGPTCSGSASNFRQTEPPCIIPVCFRNKNAHGFTITVSWQTGFGTTSALLNSRTNVCLKCSFF